MNHLLQIPTTGTRSFLVSEEWAGTDVDTYLDRCQVDTPDRLVSATWDRVLSRRSEIGKVVDFGAGDGRFALGGKYREYTGYEMDWSRSGNLNLPEHARILHGCAFSAPSMQADLCIGNPPFVRNQDLPSGWREKVAGKLEMRSGVMLSGLANAWQYFFLLNLLATAEDGITALVIPYEWVSRPSAKAIREYILANGWDVDVYRLDDAAFAGVLTTASITIVDKRGQGSWRFFRTDIEMVDEPLASATGVVEGHISYASRRAKGTFRAVRGLSPGTQKVFVLTEAERSRLGLKVHRDVVRCVTSMKDFPSGKSTLDEEAFDKYFRNAGKKCWLIDPRKAELKGPLRAYIDSVNPTLYATATCMERENWWAFSMPDVPAALVASCFKGHSPKSAINAAGVIAVGGVIGIHGGSIEMAGELLDKLSETDLRQRLVSHANGLMKLEIGQLNTLMEDWSARGSQ